MQKNKPVEEQIDKSLQEAKEGKLIKY